MTGRPASGRQHHLEHGRYRACVASVGASLRLLTADGRDLVVPFAADQVRPAYRGVTLAPWPNRIADGRYTFDGVEHQVALTEPLRGNALHGLAAWLDYEVVRQEPGCVVLATTIEPQAGYPWRVLVETTYALADDGLTQTVRAVNLSDRPAPFGTGPHPYLVAGHEPLDDWTLTLPADQVLAVTEDRLLPTALEPVEDDADRFDFRRPRRIGATCIDHAFTGLQRDAGGAATVRISAPGGTGVAMRWDTGCAWVQIHTADLPDDPARPGHRAGLAVEPMTCAPDAFNADRYEHPTGLAVLEPAGVLSASWTITATG